MLFILNDAFRVPDFLCSPSASGFWWCWGRRGERRGEAKAKKISGFKEIFTCGKTFTHAQLQLPVPYPKRASKLQWTHTFIANPTRNAFQREKKGRKHHLEKKFKTSKEGFFTEEEVNYDNYSDW